MPLSPELCGVQFPDLDMCGARSQAKDDTTTISNQNAAFDPNGATLQEPFLPGTAAAFEEPDHAGFRPVNRRDSLLLNGHSEPSDQELVLVSVV